MATQIDYAIALGLFFAAFIVMTSLVANHASALADAQQELALEAYAESLLGIADMPWNGDAGKISAAGVGTDAFSFEITAAGSDGLVEFSFDDVGISADQNSVAIYRKGSQQPLAYSLAGDNIRFVAPPGATEFVVWFDDDSAFPPRSTTLPDKLLLQRTLWQPEQHRIVQYAALEKLKQKDYSSMKEDYDFQILLADNAGNVIFSYGPAPPATVKVAEVRRPVAFQNVNADVVFGEMRAGVWMVK